MTVKNPNRVTAPCVDHAKCTNHRLLLQKADDPTDPGSSMLIGMGTVIGNEPDGAPIVVFDVQLQPIDFGSYVGTLFAQAGSLESDGSPVSEAFERGPNSPGKPVFSRKQG